MFELLNGALSGMQAGPKPLTKALVASAMMNDVEAIDPGTLRGHLESAPAGDDVVTVFRRALAGWDNEEAAWTGGVERNSRARRDAIYTKLGFDPEWIRVCETKFPFHSVSPPVVIAREHTAWYDEKVRAPRSFYWNAYVGQLRAQGWTDESIRQFDTSTTSVVERLADPTSVAAYQSKGLVVGYVQSGKTANFTGVIAKAADAGYKLIIVLAGTLDVLRFQTQRRIDKDLIGQELLDDNYASDADWSRFLKHGNLPSKLGSFDFHRLTGPDSDYQSLKAGLEALQFEAAEKSKPLFDKENIFRARTRIAIVKKNSKILKRLLTDLRRTRDSGQGAPLDQIPALIIDDESDQASINVSKPTADADSVDRKPTNQAIVHLLGLLPRAQYVGYTATPFANVFVDPNNEEDIFPKDFLISLPRPTGYMGVSDFYDLEGSQEDKDSKSNERDYVRPVVGDDAEPKNLQAAIDAFVLSGAIKRFRATVDSRLAASFRHHTMLVHSSEKVAEQANLADQVRKIYAKAGYEGGRGVERLEKLFDEDFKRVHAARGAELPFPGSFEELAPFIGECLGAIGPARGAVRIVNNLNKDQTPDFERQAIWKFVVGGTKLSRGYTVEGLTVSYYRRRAQSADTLMQMGRWFGFRRGYGDLVRLHIGTKEPLPGSGRGIINLYEAFGAVCRDEEAFREELKRYAEVTEPRITPAQIPPLVPQHMLRPTASNKMYNAILTYINFGGKLSESTIAPNEPDDIAYNNTLLDKIVGTAKARPVKLAATHLVGKDKDKPKFHELSANVVELSPAAVVELLEKYRWYGTERGAPRGTNPMRLQMEFLRKRGAEDPQIDDWLLLGPRIEKASAVRPLAGVDFDVVFRSRRDNEKYRFNTYNDPIHRRFAEHIACLTTLQNANAELTALRQPRRGVLIYYPIFETKPKTGKPKPPFTVGFTLLFPSNGIVAPVRFSVHRADLSDAAVVNV
ncbi:Z1 domain-containing protein [Roseomonas indoligenes]|uniref:Z1 domain-containing protein n=1 Tax=Roseomonas indoligenes TaxID=2820811 RepID=A0A940N8J1_9PROT|nr:Z1 domain-containing protein [Pararoseomonas indoligenes]MBP0496012.1 Z1 domain-containing protein [Pararoseomonas indoligenes]